MKLPSKTREEPKACTRKYFKALSNSLLFILQTIIGIKDNKFISKPAQTKSQLQEDTEIKVLNINLTKKK